MSKMTSLESMPAVYLLLIQLTLWTNNGIASLILPPTVRRPPKIAEELPEEYFALPTSLIELKCAADAFPGVKETGRYYWKKDGNIFNVSEVGEDKNQSSLQVTMSQVDGTLYFNGSESLQQDEMNKVLPYEGKYQCFAKNEWGTSISREVNLKVGMMAPFIGMVDEVLIVNEGESKQIPCRNNNGEDVEINWFFIPNHVQLSNRIAQATDGTIVFTNIVAKEDDGLKFNCLWTYKSTRSSIDGTHYTLSVKTDNPVEGKEPNIIRPKKHKEKRIALKGETLKLTCIATGNPTPSVYWTRKGKELDDIGIDEEDRYDLVDYNRTLYINNVDYGDEGEYTCTASNDIDIRRRDIEVIVEARPYFSSEDKKPTDMVKVPGGTVEIRCQLEGIPKPQVDWLRNGIPIDEVSIEGDIFDDRIVLRDLKESDTAVYQCIGRNKHGTVLGQGFLNVLTSPPIPLPGNEFLYRKMEGNIVEMKCGMFSSPNHTVKWTKYGQPQRDLLWDGRISTLKDTSTLKIKSINPDDSGEYKCEATNKYGSASIDITLYVLDQTNVRPTPGKEIHTVPKGDEVTMSVEPFTDGNLSWYTVNWFKEGYHLGEGITLTLLSVTLEDEGDYTVILKTEFDHAKTTVKLIVQDVPTQPRNLIFTVDESDPYAGILNWEAQTTDTNPPILNYKVEYEATELYPDEWKSLVDTADNIANADVKKLEPYVDYSFRVWAVNQLGTSEYPSVATSPYKTPEKEPDVNPRNVVGKGTSPNNMVITWDPVDPMKHAGPGFGYEVSWCLESNCNWDVAFSDNTSYTVTGTSPHTKYFINVTSANDKGRAPTPVLVIGYSGEDIPLEAPSDFTHTIGNDSMVTVSWKPVPEEKMRGLVTGYLVQAKDKDTNKTINKTVERYKLSTRLELEPFSEYEITVTASNSAGESAPSTVIRFKTPEGLPDSPEKLTVTKRKLKALELEWKAPSKVKGIIISYRLDYVWKEENETKSDTKIVLKEKVKLKHLEPGTSYHVTLCAQTSRGFGEKCAKISATTLEPQKPRDPEYDIVMDYELANITWEISKKDQTEGIPIRSFVVQHKPNKIEKQETWMSSDKIFATPDSWHYSISIRNLTPGTKYAFRLLSTNEYGQSTSNSSVKMTPGAVYQSGSGIVGQPWFIVVLCVAALIIFVVVIICFMRRRKGGKYSVSEKEEQLVKLESQPMNNDESGKYSLNHTNDLKEENGTTVVDDPATGRRLRGDSVGGNSIEAFGSGDTRDFEEDGSFIDQYGIERRSHGKSGVSSPTSDDSKDISNAQTRLLKADAV